MPCDVLSTGSRRCVRSTCSTRAVDDAADAPLTLSMLFTGAGGERLEAVLGTVLALLGLGGFMWFAARSARGTTAARARVRWASGSRSSGAGIVTGALSVSEGTSSCW